jgi:hypothetical protein
MRLFIKTLILLAPLPCLLSAQSWEVGASGGYGLYRNKSVTSGSLTGSAGFDSGFAAGALLGNQMNSYVGGEARYTFRKDDLKVSSGSTKATAGAQSHALHYDVLIHGAKKGSPVRPFLAAGAGVKWYRGTGAEPVFQPLSNLVVLTHTSEAQPLVSVGGGVKVSVSKRALFRLDFRDYTTPLPNNLLATPATAKIGGWVHDFVFLAGISSVF